MIMVVFWFMLDVNNFGSVTYYSFKSDSYEITQKYTMSFLQSH